MEWWSGGVVEWWSGGVVEWWSGGVVKWWSGGVVEWWSGDGFGPFLFHPPQRLELQFCDVTPHKSVVESLIASANVSVVRQKMRHRKAKLLLGLVK
jgi:hypothetical protein